MAVYKDLSGRSASTGALVRRGAVAGVIIVVVAILLTLYARGDFDRKFDFTIDATTVGDGLTPGSDVKFRGMAIGRVTEVETVDYGHQRLHVAIEPGMSDQLTDTMTGKFTSSNVFGSTAVELIADGTGTPLQQGSTLELGSDVSNVTVTSVFRRLADLTDVLDSSEMQRVLDLMAHVSEEFGPNLKPFFDTARMMTETQRSPLAWKLHRGGELGDGLNNFVPPAVQLVSDVVASSAYFENPENGARAKKAMNGLMDTLIVPIGDLLGKQAPDLFPLLNTLMDVAVPLTSSLGTVAPTYNRVSEVLDGVDDAFPMVNGDVQLQLAVIVRNMPNMAGPVEAFLANAAAAATSAGLPLGAP